MRQTRPVLLDLFCGAGGAAMGYYQAGYDVIGVDNRPQKRYPFPFIRADALEFLASAKLGGFDLIHTSPPCQAYSSLKSMTKKEWPSLLPQVRTLLQSTGKDYVIENVIGAPVTHSVILCGGMFGLRTYRHRHFETSQLLMQPPHPRHVALTSTKKRRRDLAAGMHVSITGDVGRWLGPPCMGIDWMTGDELSQAVPPAFTRWVGMQLLGMSNGAVFSLSAAPED